MSRRQKFEQAYAEAHGMPVETFETYRMGDTYRLPGIAKCWRFWNMALDSVVVELPDDKIARGYGEQVADALGFNDGVSYCREAIEAAGLRVAP